MFLKKQRLDFFKELYGGLSKQRNSGQTEVRISRRGDVLFHGSSLIPVLLSRPCHTRMGTARAQMATDGESEVPLQI